MKFILCSVYTRSANVDSYCFQNHWPSNLIKVVPDWLDTAAAIIIHVLTPSRINIQRLTSTKPLAALRAWTAQQAEAPCKHLNVCTSETHFKNIRGWWHGVSHSLRAETKCVFKGRWRTTSVSSCNNELIIYENNSIFSDAFCQTWCTQWLLLGWEASGSSPLCLCLPLTWPLKGTCHGVCVAFCLSTRSSLIYKLISVRGRDPRLIYYPLKYERWYLMQIFMFTILVKTCLLTLVFKNHINILILSIGAAPYSSCQKHFS